MGELEDEFRRGPGRLVTKWRHYFDNYESHLAPLRGRPVLLLEFGVWHGGSLQLRRQGGVPTPTENSTQGVAGNRQVHRSLPGNEIAITSAGHWELH